jgi:sulfonate transport system substrate-binding protein
MMTRTESAIRRRGAMALWVAITVAVLGCSSAPAMATILAKKPSVSTAQLRGVTLRVGDAESIQKVALADSGALTGAPYNVTFTEFSAGPAEFAGIQGGAIDVGSAGDTAAIFAAGGNVPFKVVAALPESGKTLAIVVPDKSPIQTVAQLKGATIAVQSGTIVEYYLVQTLKSAHLTPSDVHRDSLASTVALAALNSGSVQAMVTQQPYTGLAEKSGSRILTIGNSFSFNGMVVASKSALTSKVKVAAIADYIRRLNTAFSWARSHQAQYFQSLAAVFHIPASLAETLGPGITPAVSEITPKIVAETQIQANVFHQLGELTSKLNAKTMFTSQFNSGTKALHG